MTKVTTHGKPASIEMTSPGLLPAQTTPARVHAGQENTYVDAC
jgi:hypothetical protein